MGIKLSLGSSKKCMLRRKDDNAESTSETEDRIKVHVLSALLEWGGGQQYIKVKGFSEHIAYILGNFFPTVDYDCDTDYLPYEDFQSNHCTTHNSDWSKIYILFM